MLPTGAIVDRFGVKPLMIGGAALATASTFTAAVAPSFTVIIVTQFFWGIGMSTWMFGREVAAVDMVRRDQRGRQMSALMGIGSTGMAFGPAIGGVLTDLMGVRGLFFVYAGMSAVVLVISLLHQEISRPKTQRSSAPLFDLRAFGQIHPYFRATYMVLFFATFAQMIRGQVTNTMLPLYVQSQLEYSASLTGFAVHCRGRDDVPDDCADGDHLGQIGAEVGCGTCSSVLDHRIHRLSPGDEYPATLRRDVRRGAGERARDGCYDDLHVRRCPDACAGTVAGVATRSGASWERSRRRRWLRSSRARTRRGYRSGSLPRCTCSRRCSSSGWLGRVCKAIAGLARHPRGR